MSGDGRGRRAPPRLTRSCCGALRRGPPLPSRGPRRRGDGLGGPPTDGPRAAGASRDSSSAIPAPDSASLPHRFRDHRLPRAPRGDAVGAAPRGVRPARGERHDQLRDPLMPRAEPRVRRGRTTAQGADRRNQMPFGVADGAGPCDADPVRDVVTVLAAPSGQVPAHSLADPQPRLGREDAASGAASAPVRAAVRAVARQTALATSLSRRAWPEPDSAVLLVGRGLRCLGPRRRLAPRLGRRRGGLRGGLAEPAAGDPPPHASPRRWGHRQIGAERGAVAGRRPVHCPLRDHAPVHAHLPSDEAPLRARRPSATSAQLPAATRPTAAW